MSKPTNPDPKTINEIVALTQGGIPLPLIAKALGLTTEQIAGWLEAGLNEKNKTLATFAAEYEKAKALAEIDLLTKLNKHAKEDPNAAFKLLEYQAKQKEAPREGSTALENGVHEAFCVLVATGGKKGGPAYREITGIKPASADVAACHLLRNPKVKARIAALKAATAQRKCLTKERRLEICYEVAESATASHTDRLRAAKLDADLKGEMVVKQELTGQDGVPLPSAIGAIIITPPRASARRAQ